jgi:hypothetical protein
MRRVPVHMLVIVSQGTRKYCLWIFFVSPSLFKAIKYASMTWREGKISAINELKLGTTNNCCCGWTRKENKDSQT